MLFSLSNTEYISTSEIFHLGKSNDLLLVYVLCLVVSMDLRSHRMYSLFGDAMGLLPDTQNCGLRMRRECRERFPLHR